MEDFRNQIKEDIREYQIEHPHIANIKKDEWAFNYWVLDKLFYEDEELIEEKIIDYHDMGIDAFEIYEDTKDIYLLQNKYFSDETILSAEYVKNDFLLRAITALENGTYKKSEELQSAFSKWKAHSDFTVYLQLFVTNNRKSMEADEYVKRFNREHPKYRAAIFYLDDIKEKYFGEHEENHKSITAKIESINKGTILNINTEAYKMENVVDAKYVLTPIVSVYKLYRETKEKAYPLFDKNIREYLGNKGVNKKMYKTLMDGEDRKNFFYYNNGITIICDKIGTPHTQTSLTNRNVYVEITNPQIVNGCQTVNTIYEVLKNVDPDKLEREYKDAFVMLKILEIGKNELIEETLYKNIVLYNNSQNSITEKQFQANADEFLRLRTEFENRGFLLLVKQSDKNSFSQKYKVITKLKEANHQRLLRFGLPEMKKASDVFIPLEKFLQVINAFAVGGEVAFTKKANMLKVDREEHKTAMSFIKNGSVTIDVMLDLYLLYKRAYIEQRKSENGRLPIPYYLIDGFAKYECEERKEKLILSALDTNEKIEYLIKLYIGTSKYYCIQYEERYKIDYNKMIKRSVEYELLSDGRKISSAFL